MDGRHRNSRIILQKTITISQSHKDILIGHAERNFPNESCALLFGHEKGGAFEVSDVFLAENQDDSPVNFTIANEELLKGYQEADAKGLDVIGIFHSHPHSEASPSSTDRKFMEINPVAWLIFSNKLDQLNAYVLESDVVQLAIEIV